MTRALPISVVFATLIALSAPPLTQPAAAQQAPAPAPGAFQLMPKETLLGIKHHASFMLSGGFDLDVLGNVMQGGLGTQGGNAVAVRQAAAYPDVYVTVPKRVELVAGYGLFQRDEIIARISRATYTSEPLEQAGNFVGSAGSGDLTVTFSQYRERTWEVGWRHYLVMTRRAKQYANMIYGIRTVDPITAAFVVSDPVGSIGTFKLYDRSKLQTFSLELGLTFEAAHVGVFAQVGARFQQRLTRNDEDLKPWSLEPLNDTGMRFYMPLQFGVLLRL